MLDCAEAQQRLLDCAEAQQRLLDCAEAQQRQQRQQRLLDVF
ncbi:MULTISPECIES: hypothetical protein [Planktothrix]|nr:MULTISPECIES: hypothetical protein [Planktothrix]